MIPKQFIPPALRAPMQALLVLTLAALLGSCAFHSYWLFEYDGTDDTTLRANPNAKVTFFKSFASWWSDQTATILVTSRSHAHVVIERADIFLRRVDEHDVLIDSTVLAPIWRWELAGPEANPELIRYSHGATVVSVDTGKFLATLDGKGNRFRVDVRFPPQDIERAQRLRASVYLRMYVNDTLIEVRRDIYLKKETHSYYSFGRDC